MSDLQNRRKIHYLSISSQKGGVAKTTTTISLGAALAETGLRVLMVDLDPQAHLTQAVGLNPDNARYTVGDVLLNQASIVEASRDTEVKLLDILTANRGLILVERLLHTTKDYEYRLKQSFEILNGQYYDVILFDCPPSFGPLTVNALTTSSQVIIPVTTDYFSVQSLQAYLRLLDLVRRNSNPNIQHYLLVTMFDRRTNLSKMILDQYRKNYADTMLKTIIPVDARLRESPIFGRPITEYSSSTRSASGYRSLARELIKCLEVMN